MTKLFILLLIIYIVIIVFLVIFFHAFGERYYIERTFSEIQTCPFGKEIYEIESTHANFDTNLSEGIISYSLYGNFDKYSINLIKSLQNIPDLMPGWHARIYTANDIPQSILDELVDLGGEVIVMGPNPPLGHEGALWRFLPAKELKPFASLDADDEFDEAIAKKIKNWLKSGKVFGNFSPHVLILEIAAGLWAARPLSDGSAPIPNIDELLNNYCSHTFGFDEAFLRTEVEPLFNKYGFYKSDIWWLRYLAIIGIILLIVAIIFTLVWSYDDEKNK